MWTLDQALVLIRTLQPELHNRGYHMALGGGVLNAGRSDKDLDLYVFPFDRSLVPPILPYFETLWGPFTAFANSLKYPMCEDYPPDLNFQVKGRFDTPSGRIDLFISVNGYNGEII